jgi:hypothetical protein
LRRLRNFLVDGSFRLEGVFAIIDQPAKGKTCDAINGIIDESTEVMKEFKGSPALDAGLLASAHSRPAGKEALGERVSDVRASKRVVQKRGMGVWVWASRSSPD